jgi:hypothetical protein
MFRVLGLGPANEFAFDACLHVGDKAITKAADHDGSVSPNKRP